MGHLTSCVQKINDLRFETFPLKRALTGVFKCVCVNGIVYALNKRGIVYTNGEMGGKVCYCETGSNYHAVEAVQLLGLISKEEAEKHGEKRRAQNEAYIVYRAATCEVSTLAAVGIKLTASQKRRLSAMKQKLDVTKPPYFLKEEATQKLALIK